MENEYCGYILYGKKITNKVFLCQVLLNRKILGNLGWTIPTNFDTYEHSNFKHENLHL